MKKFYFLMSMAAMALAGSAAEVSDTLTVGLFNFAFDSTYKTYDLDMASGNVYNCTLAKKQRADAMQLRSNDDVSGFVTTTSVGVLKAITVEWYDQDNMDTRVLNLYGQDEAYESTSDLYAVDEEGKSATNLIKKIAIADGLNQTITLADNEYRYIGVRSDYGAQYISKIIFTYEVEDEVADYCNNYGDLNTTRDDRALTSLTLSADGDTLVVNDIQEPMGKIYNDRTGDVFNVLAGQTVSIKANGKGSWMHGYVWVDWNNDKEFVAAFDEDGAVANNSELVAFNFYGPTSENKGYDSNGNSTPNNVNGYQANLEFKVPEGLPAGDYRLRYIIAWNNIDPCGEAPQYDSNGNIKDGNGLNPFTAAGGSITDITLRVEATDAVITYTIGEGAGRVTLTDLGTYNPVPNGGNVSLGNTLMIAVIAEEEEGYLIDSITINGEAVENVHGIAQKQIPMVVEGNIDIVASFFIPEPEYCNNYEGVAHTRTDRSLDTITLSTGNDNTLVIDEIQNVDNPTVYIDKTDNIFYIEPGQTVTLTSTGTGSWMHSYVWIDWNNDREFVAAFDENGAVANNSELVAFSFYNESGESTGVDYKGNPASNNTVSYNASFEFKVPETLTLGHTYRLRYIIAWNNIDPCGQLANEEGKNSLVANGGSITDITLKYDPESGLQTVETAAEDVAPVFYNLQGVRVANPSNGVYIMVRGNKAQKVLLNK